MTQDQARPVLDTLGKRLRFARTARGFTQRGLAKEAGLNTSSHVGVLETDRGGNVVADVILRLSRALAVPMEWLLEGGQLPESLLPEASAEPTVTFRDSHPPTGTDGDG